MPYLSPVQAITLAVAIGTAGLMIAYAIRYREDKEALLKTTILASVVIHFILFYSCLALTPSFPKIREAIIWVFQDPTQPFGAWSAALRLHTALAILTKEIISLLVRRIYRRG
jgi:hypothetical protein